MDFHDSDRRARSCQIGNGNEKWGNLHGARPADGFYHATGKALLMNPKHISELIAELIASGKLPSDKPARPVRKPVRKPVRRARQMKLKLN
jgi:hypothetical protein